uniref:Uncharacterized protein n=1 Tax=Arundo donax TaxID=35708 RepID=A0A0A9H7J9_ARUDO
MMSSANKRCDIAGPVAPFFSPFSRLDCSSVFNKLKRPSAHSKKRYGLIRSPCLKPQEGINGSDSSPFTLIAYQR